MRLLLLILMLAMAGITRADTPAKDAPLIAISRSKTCLVSMLPGKYRIGKNDIVSTLREPVATVYRLRANGSLQVLWRLRGWYSFNPHLSNDCRYLALLQYGGFGREPGPLDYGLTFFDRGKLLKRHLVADLIKDYSKLFRSVSHYSWVAFAVPLDIHDTGDDKYDASAELGVQYDNTFKIKSLDGIRYVFDMTTGEIKEKSP